MLRNIPLIIALLFQEERFSVVVLGFRQTFRIDRIYDVVALFNELALDALTVVLQYCLVLLIFLHTRQSHDDFDGGALVAEHAFEAGGK